MLFYNTVQSLDALDFTWVAYVSQLPQGVTVRMTHRWCAWSIKIPPFLCEIINTLQGEIFLKKNMLLKTIWIKRLINICSFAVVKCSFIRIIKSWLKMLSTSLTAKQNFKWKRNIWSLRWEACICSTLLPPCGWGWDTKSVLMKESLLEFQARILKCVNPCL